MSISTKKRLANRRNAQKSTGPTTDEGKAISRRNALKHGLTGQGVALPDELKQVSNKRPNVRDMAEFRIFDPDLNAIDLSQTKGFEVDFDVWERAAGRVTGRG